jgi:GT2 family glycosyltransferase
MEALTLGRDVTIATAAHGNVTTTALCLQAILASAVGDFELILIDDCSPDAASLRMLFDEAARRHQNTRIYSFTENLEYTGSVNAVLSQATGQRVFFISNDIFITPLYLRTLLALAASDPALGILRGSSNFVDNGLPAHNLTPDRPVNNLTDLFAVAESCAQRFGHALLPDPFLVGDAFMVTRALIERIGTFDPAFYGYFGDPDFGLRARIAGFTLGVAPGAFAYHRRNANFEYLPAEQRQAKLHRRWMRVFENWARFKMKYGMPVPQPYTSIAAIDWDLLATTPFDPQRHYSAPGDYTRYLVG